MAFEHIIDVTTFTDLTKHYALGFGQSYNSCNKEELILLLRTQDIETQRLQNKMNDYLRNTQSNVTRISQIKRMPKEAKQLLKYWFGGDIYGN